MKTLLYQLGIAGIFGICAMFFSTNLSAATVELQFAQSSVDCSASPQQFCTTVQIRTTAGTTQIANSTIFFYYDPATLANPSETPINYFTGDGYQQTDFSFAVSGGTGIGNYAITLGNDNVSSSKDVTTAWLDVVEFCFDILDNSGDTGLVFDIDETGFNDEDNDPNTTGGTVEMHGVNYPAGVSGNTTNAFNGEVACAPVNLKVFLEGPYDYDEGTMSGSQQMLTLINPFFLGGVLIPTAQPYSVAPWNYSGTETIASPPSDMVDWVLVHATTAQSSAGIIETQAAILKDNGDIESVNGGQLYFNKLVAGTNYAFIVRHRNHIDVCSEVLSPTGGAFTKDFTGAQVISNGFEQLKGLNNGKFVMRGGDADADVLVINTDDYNIWSAEKSELGLYLQSDFNLDGLFNTADYNIWSSNSSELGDFINLAP